MNFYRTILLSYLTAVNYDQPLENLNDLVESDLTTYIFKDENDIQLADSPRESEKLLWAKTQKEGSLVDFSMPEFQIALAKVNNGEESYLMPMYDYSSRSTRDIKKLGQPLFRRLKEPFRLLPNSFLLPKNGPFSPTFDKFIMRAFDHGLFKKISYKYQLREGTTA